MACPFHESQTVAPVRPNPAYCTDREFYGAIDYLLEQAPVLGEHEPNQSKRIKSDAISSSLSFDLRNHT